MTIEEIFEPEDTDPYEPLSASHYNFVMNACRKHVEAYLEIETSHLPDDELIMDFKITLQYEIDNTFTLDLSERADFFGWANRYISSVAQKMVEIRSTM